MIGQDMLTRIFWYIDIEDLVRLERVCKEWKLILNSMEIWKLRYESDFNGG